MKGALVSLEEARRILGPVAEGLTDRELARKVATFERFARWAVAAADRGAPPPHRPTERPGAIVLRPA